MRALENSENMFLPHLHDSFRKEIAIQYIQHEWRKLFPQSRGKDLWQSIDRQIENWYEMLTIRNFWNAIHGITIGFRLTSIIPWITSINVKWTKREISFNELYFRGKFGPITSLEVETPELAASVKKAIFLPENSKFLEETKKYFEFHKDDTEPRSDHPIFVVKKKGKLQVIDGNGRTLKAIVEGKDSINAVVGEPIAEPVFYEHWVPTSLMVDLVFWYKHQSEIGRDALKTTAQIITELIRDSSAARIEFEERAVHHGDEAHVRLLKEVERQLGD